MGTFDGTVGLDTLTGTASADTFNFQPGELVSTDIVKGRGGVDQLRFLNTPLNSSLFLDAKSFTNVFSMETFEVTDSLTDSNITVSNTLVSRSGWAGNASKEYDMEFSLGIGRSVIDFRDVKASYHLLVDAEDGNDDIYGGKNSGLYLGGGGIDFFFAGTGAETFKGEAGATFVQGGADEVDGDAYWGSSEAAESIEVTSGGTFDFTARDFELLFLANAANTAKLTMEWAEDGFQIEGGSQSDAITLFISPGLLANGHVLTVNGNGGNDFIYGTDTGEMFSGNGDDDHLEGGGGGDTLSGGNGIDYLQGDDGHDTLDGGGDADIMIGGKGDDAYLDVNAGDLLAESSDEGHDLVETALATFTLGGNFEDLRFTGGSKATLTGSNINNIIWGGGKADTIKGLDGKDTLFGYGGGDTLEGGSGNDALWGGKAIDTLRGNDGEDGLFGEAGNDMLYGQKNDDVFVGGGGSDVLDGGRGRDTADYSGSGNSLTANFVLGNEVFHGSDIDTLIRIEVLFGSKADDVFTNATFAAIEFSGGGGYDILDVGMDTANIQVFGAAPVEEIYTGSGDDLLKHFIYMDGGAGNDLFFDDDAQASQNFHGNDGSDTVSYQDSGGIVVQTDLRIALDGSLPNTGWAANDKFSLIENLTGNNATEDVFFGNGEDNRFEGLGGNDTFYGDDGGDTLIGGAGSDYIEGGSGADIVNPGADEDICYGGGGTDTLSYESLSGGVGVIAAATSDGLGTAIFGAGAAVGDYLEGFENLIGSGSNDQLTGDSYANTIKGENGADIIEGGGGGDTLEGGSAIDTLSYASSGKAVTINLLTSAASGGDADDDTIIGFESLLGSSKDDNLTGDSGGNEIEGGNGGDTLDGGLGENTLSYAGSDGHVVVDILDGTSSQHDAGGDTFVNFANLRGGAFDDRLHGDNGVNKLWGGEGADTLSGRDGADQFHGEGGADQFRYYEIEDSPNTGPADFIWDFSRVEGDVIDLSRIDAMRGGGDEAFVMTAGEGAGAATGANGELWWISNGDGSFDVYANTDGTAGADFRIIVTAMDAGGSLASADFNL